jgi:hypothetical protein
VILRIRQPNGIVRDTPNVPSVHVALHPRAPHAITGGVRVTPAPTSVSEYRAMQLAEAAKAYRDRQREVRA